MNASVHLMGLGEFKMGHTISKINRQKEEPKKSYMSRLNSLFEELEAKKEKLKEIVANINTTDENKVLVNSILGMKSFKVLKFSAKVNDDGKVTIDENMIEVDQVPDIRMRIPTDVPQVTYASRLTGIGRKLADNEVKVWCPSVNGSEEKYVNIAVEYHNVLDKCTHCMVFGHSLNVCKVRPRTLEEIAINDNRMEAPHARQTEKTNQSTPHDNDGFTLVTRRKGNGEGGHRKENNGTNGIIQDRNIVNRTPRYAAPPVLDEEIGHPPNPNKTYTAIPPISQGNSTQNNVIDHRKPKEQNPPEKEPYIKMVETSNRFVLLDREGKELHDIEEAMDTCSNGQSATYKQGNERWAKKQERVINTKYANLINQDKRYEVKRYIIDRLVPLESTLSEWSRPMLEYFRHLCSIYEFGEGSLAVTYEKISMLDPLNSEEINKEISMDEVESEVDGTAGMMRSDAPLYSTTTEPLDEATGNGSQSNPTTVIMLDVQSVGKD
ncbi:hypothetical protein L1987_14058 [Smallanthus sonchifolius]|uniref:Uncharacterized protein n=1 Tax=Smallanthus sonchifolius TaxID=185202 RepID=A0ACB9JIN3_9ASTR|nr:hypothetical protein L1987_14058 [Smallanthus sonchifolius]